MQQPRNKLYSLLSTWQTNCR